MRAHKREAITRAARAAFARDGYARTGVEAIAAEAAVSTRTIYNHFTGKEELFTAVLQASATQVAEAFLARVERDLTGEDPTYDLVALGRAVASQRTDFPEHFAMVRQITAESPHFPPAIIRAWQEAGPLRVEREVVRRLRSLADRGLLRIADPPRAALHFMALATAGIPIRPAPGAPALTGDDITETVTAGVAAFLNGYGADGPAPPPDPGGRVRGLPPPGALG